MGQRTQVLVTKKETDGKKQVKFYHLQWGFGRQMYLGFMDMVINNLFSYERESEIKCNRFYDITDEITEEQIENLSIDNFELVTEIFKQSDNNNGGLVIEVTMPEDKYELPQYKIGFLLGYGDETRRMKGFAKWLSPSQYGKYNGGSCYSDKDFVKMFNNFCKYFEVQIMEN